MLLLKNLSNHTRYYHILPDYINSTRYLGGICVDPDRGIYMIRRSFSGTSHPLHVLHNFGVNGGFSCELNDCRNFTRQMYKLNTLMLTALVNHRKQRKIKHISFIFLDILICVKMCPECGMTYPAIRSIYMEFTTSTTVTTSA
jgi:hypothetical protein